MFLGVVVILVVMMVDVGEDWLVISVSAIIVVGMRVGLVRMRAVAPDFVGFVIRVGAVTGFCNSEKY